MGTAIHINALNKTFRGGRKALQDIHLSIHAGEMVALIGASGSATWSVPQSGQPTSIDQLRTEQLHCV